MNSELVLYQSDELPERIEVMIENETVWLNRQQLSVLFGRDIKTIGKHINNVFLEGELVKEVYHLGASLKDLGKKWFAFSKMDKNSVENIINGIEK